METEKDLLNFTNDAVFYDYKSVGIICELNPVGTYIINRFIKTIPYTRVLKSLCIIDDIILKINHNDIKNILDDVHNLREQIMYMLSFEKTAKDEEQMAIVSKLIDEEKICFLYKVKDNRNF